MIFCQASGLHPSNYGIPVVQDLLGPEQNVPKSPKRLKDYDEFQDTNRKALKQALLNVEPCNTAQVKHP